MVTCHGRTDIKHIATVRCLWYGSFRTHQRGPGMALRSRSPETARQEIWAMLRAYQGIRILMWQAAATAGCDPGRLSFTRALNVTRRAVPGQAGLSPLTPGRPPG